MLQVRCGLGRFGYLTGSQIEAIELLLARDITSSALSQPVGSPNQYWPLRRADSAMAGLILTLSERALSTASI